MAEYIERERLIHHLQNCIYEVKNTNGCPDDFEICLRAIQNQPAADVSEVKHGCWNYYRETITTLPHFRCSVCGNPRYESYTWNEFKYCPSCGAKMDT